MIDKDLFHNKDLISPESLACSNHRDLALKICSLSRNIPEKSILSHAHICEEYVHQTFSDIIILPVDGVFNTPFQSLWQEAALRATIVYNAFKFIIGSDYMFLANTFEDDFVKGYCISTYIRAMMRTPRVQFLFALARSGPLIVTCCIIKIWCNETDKFDWRLVAIVRS